MEKPILADLLDVTNPEERSKILAKAVTVYANKITNGLVPFWNADIPAILFALEQVQKTLKEQEPAAAMLYEMFYGDISCVAEVETSKSKVSFFENKEKP